ncbi:MAG: alpha-galactosidase [Clostridium sp.]|nr:alpha-galactosidase [Clostridium sp.]
MIIQEENTFILHTAHTTYCFCACPSGQLEHLYYGRRIEVTNAEAFREKRAFEPGNAIVYAPEYPELCLENVKLEMSGVGKGDLREPFVELIYPDGNRTTDFIYESAQVEEGGLCLQGLPTACGAEQTLTVTMRDRHYPVELLLTYSVYPECDVITRSARLVSHLQEPLTIRRLMSLQLDMQGAGLRMTTFHGAWAREMGRVDAIVENGTYVNQTRAGVTSNRANNFVMLSDPQTNEDAGEALGFHLLYSGSHYEALDVNAYEKSRFVSGIQPADFSWTLAQDECFEAPEAAMTYSFEGFGGMSRNLHAFIREHIVRGTWQHKPRPILINSWESAYFDFKERNLCKLAKTAKEVGAELFVMDDGWFGKRNSDTCSLGDWQVNEKKLPGGLQGIADKIHEMGLDFGIWVEPEMVNEDSDLYRAHPDWVAVSPGGGTQALGRHQMFLDFTRSEVRDYIIEQMRAVFSVRGINYVKWDMNRVFSDQYSAALPPQRQGEFAHRYVLGLYEVMRTLTQEFPHILFEACASGGNRFDLGMLCYMPQIWASDNTDAVSRLSIQEGYSYGYPMSVLGAHVSGCPNHQTLRVTPLETRFHVAAFGLLGYECNLTEMTKEELAEIREEIALYKQWRDVFFEGDFYRLENGRETKWAVVSKDKSRAVGMIVQTMTRPNHVYAELQMKGLDEKKKYHFYNRTFRYHVKEFGDLVNTVAPIHVKRDSLLHNAIDRFVKLDGEKEDYTVSGGELMYAGIALKQGYGGTGYSGDVRHFPDYASRMYYMEEAPEGEDLRGQDLVEKE